MRQLVIPAVGARQVVSLAVEAHEQVFSAVGVRHQVNLTINPPISVSSG
jgi:hypothetical protein